MVTAKVQWLRRDKKETVDLIADFCYTSVTAHI